MNAVELEKKLAELNANIKHWDDELTEAKKRQDLVKNKVSTAQAEEMKWTSQETVSQSNKVAAEKELAAITPDETLEFCVHSNASPCVSRNAIKTKNNEERKNKRAELDKKIKAEQAAEDSARDEKAKAKQEKMKTQDEQNTIETSIKDILEQLNKLDQEKSKLVEEIVGATEIDIEESCPIGNEQNVMVEPIAPVFEEEYIN